MWTCICRQLGWLWQLTKEMFHSASRRRKEHYQCAGKDGDRKKPAVYQLLEFPRCFLNQKSRIFNRKKFKINSIQIDYIQPISPFKNQVYNRKLLIFLLSMNSRLERKNKNNFFFLRRSNLPKALAPLSFVLSFSTTASVHVGKILTFEANIWQVSICLYI